jgi:hypothetical protein
MRADKWTPPWMGEGWVGVMAPQYNRRTMGIRLFFELDEDSLPSFSGLTNMLSLWGSDGAIYDG